MKLFYNPLSSYSQKTLLGFYEKQVPFEPHLVNLMDAAEKARFRKIYPLGKVPLLEAAQHFHADGAGGTGYGDVLELAHILCLDLRGAQTTLPPVKCNFPSLVLKCPSPPRCSASGMAAVW